MKNTDQILPDQAIKVLLDLDVDLKTEKVKLRQGQYRVLAEDIYAKIDVPGFNKSPYDGYALRAQDTIGASEGNPIEFEVIEEIPAGHFPEKELGEFQAAKILTGGALPKNADFCIKYENTEFSENKVKIFSEAKPFTDVIIKGSDTTKDHLLMKKGSVIRAGNLGLVASQGYDEMEVYKKPVIGFFSSGSELVSPGESLELGKIYDSNNITFTSIFEKLGFEVKSYGIIKDDEESIKEATKRAVDESDLVVTTGGASVGDYDYALSSVKKLGGDILFWKTAMKPGGSIVLSRLNNKTIIGLSGNPGAAILGLFRVCFPYLKKLLGARELYSKKFQAILAEDFKKKSPRLRILRGNLFMEDGKIYFREKEEQGNGVLSSFIDCDAFGEIKAGSLGEKAGSLIDVYMVGNIFGSLGE